MSSGPHDAMAESRLADEVMSAAYKLADAIKAARNGHRGYRIVEADIRAEINTALSPLDLKIVDRNRL